MAYTAALHYQNSHDMATSIRDEGAAKLDAPVEHLDLATVIKVSQAISGERELGKLVDTLMRTALERAGAERAVLLLADGGDLTIEAEATASGAIISVHPRGGDLASPRLPQSIVDHVARTREALVLEDASAQEPFAADPYVRARKARSILCVPLTRQGALVAVLFLENDRVRAFTPSRTAVITLLATLAAISLENARLDAGRAQAELALRDSEEQWRAAFESNPTMYFMVDRAGNILQVNPAGAMQLGYEVNELLGRPVLDVFLESDREAVRQHAQDCFARLGETLRWEARKVRKDGEVIWVRETASAFLLKERPVLLVVCEDVTERKRTREALRESEERFRALHRDMAERDARVRRLVDANIVGICFGKFDGRIYDANDAFLRIVGYDREDLVAGRISWRNLTPPEFIHLGERAKQELITNGSIQPFDKEYFRKDGSRVPVSIGSARFGEDDGISFVFDLTERKRAEAALRMSEERFRTLMQFSFDVYWETDAQHRFIRQEFAGGLADAPPPGSELGKTRWEIPSVEPDEDGWRKHRAMLDAHLPFRDFELARLLPDGSRKYIAVSGLPVFDEAGRFIGYRGVGRHITERKQAEVALKRSEAYLAEAQRITHTGSWAADPTGKATYWSEEMFRIFGIDPDRGPVPAEEVFARMAHLEEGDRLHEAWERARREKAEIDWEHRIVSPDGTVKHVLAIGHPVLDKAGKLIEFVGTVADVTERKHAEAERAAHLWFLESMDRINRAMQGTNDLEKMMSDVLDAVLEIFACDRAWLVYPCDPQAPSWRPIMEHTAPQFPGAFALGTDLPVDTEIATLFRAVRASNGAVTSGPACELELPDQVAARFSIRSMIVMAVYPKVDAPYLFGLHQCSRPREWTGQEKRLFEEIGRRLADALTSLLMFRSLRESEQRLEEAQRIAHVGHWEADLDSGRLTLSDEACRIYGRQPMELKHWRDRLNLAHPEDRERVRRATEAAIEGGVRFDVEFRVVRPDGMVRIVHSRADITQDTSTGRRRMFGMVQDITELRHAEEALREAQSALARVNRVTTLGVLAASIAHEVNQPLGAMVTSAASCSRWLSAQPPDFERAQRALERIGQDGSRASEVIDRIRTLVKRQPPRRDRVDINEAILEVIALARDEVKKSEISLQFSLTQGLPTVEGDRIQLQQVILNLIVNAIEAMNAVIGRRKLTIHSAADGSNAVRVEVRDSGPGVDPARGNDIFEAFYTTKSEGLGMGLSISHSIIEAHGGRLWVEPNLPHGAAFQFSLPVEETVVEHGVKTTVGRGNS